MLMLIERMLYHIRENSVADADARMLPKSDWSWQQGGGMRYVIKTQKR